MFDRHFGVWPKGRPRTLKTPQTTLYQNLEITARRFPDNAAVIYYDTVISYGEIHDDVLRLAGYLTHQLGVAKGDRVLLNMQNAPQFMIAYYAILRADAVVVPINPMSRAGEIRHFVEDAGAAVMICAQDIAVHAESLIGETPLARLVVAAYADYVRVPTDLDLPAEVAAPRQAAGHASSVLWTDALAENLAPGPHLAGINDLAIIPYSSGTTGPPKGCMHSHATVGFNVAVYANWRPVPPAASQLVSLPMFHVTAMMGGLNVPFYLGTVSVVMTRWDRRVAAQLIARHQISLWTCITTMAIDLLSDPDLDAEDLTSLAQIGGGGAQMPEAIAKKLHDLTGLEFVEGYGLTETIAPSHINPPDAPHRQCLGIPVFNVDSRVVDPETLEELGPNETGEIVIHGPQVFLGYWQRPDATAEVFFERDGKQFFRSGDLGWYDEAGYFYYADRLKRMINAAGFKVWPAEVEAMLHDHPAIREVCIISTPDPRRGETVKAVIVPKDAGAPPDLAEIQAWSENRMAAYKIPRQIAIADSLPRSGAGKVLWRVLQEQERS